MTDRETNQPVAWRTTTTDGRHTHFTENGRIAEQWSESGFDVTPLFISAETPSPASHLVGRDTPEYAAAEAAFTEYFVRNYPGPDTIIFDPKWHAPKLFAAAVKAMEAYNGR